MRCQNELCKGAELQFFNAANGRHAAPSQAAWMVHPRHGEFDRTDFDLAVNG